MRLPHSPLDLGNDPSQHDVRRNPLLASWETPQGAPPFADITPAHFRAAFDAAFAAHDAEIAAITANPAKTVSTIHHRAGTCWQPAQPCLLGFYALASAHTNDDLLAIEREISPGWRHTEPHQPE